VLLCSLCSWLLRSFSAVTARAGTSSSPECHQARNVINPGRDKRGVQRFRCRDCRRTFHDCRRTLHKAEDARRYTADFRASVLAAYPERASMRGVCRVFA